MSKSLFAQTLSDKYADTEPMAVFPLNNFGGLEILYFDGEIIVSSFNFSDVGRYGIRKSRVHADENGKSFFRRYGVKYYLEDFMKVRI